MAWMFREVWADESKGFVEPTLEVLRSCLPAYIESVSATPHILINPCEECKVRKVRHDSVDDCDACGGLGVVEYVDDIAVPGSDMKQQLRDFYLLSVLKVDHVPVENPRRAA